MKTITEPQKAERFQTLEEVLNDQKCSEYILLKINEIKNKRRKIMEESPNTRFKHSPYDTLRDLNLLDPESLKAEFKLMDLKKCNLSSTVRNFISMIVLDAMHQTMMYWQKIDEKTEV